MLHARDILILQLTQNGGPASISKQIPHQKFCEHARPSLDPDIIMNHTVSCYAIFSILHLYDYTIIRTLEDM